MLDENTPHPKITLTLRQEGDVFCLKIKDNGPGIPPEIQEKIFEPFYSTKTKGSGLGLSITYQMIQYHEGSLALSLQDHNQNQHQNQHQNQSQDQIQGTEFILKLPATFKKEIESQEREFQETES